MYGEVTAVQIADILTKFDRDAESITPFEYGVYYGITALHFGALCVLPTLDYIFADPDLKATLKAHKNFDAAMMHINHGKIPTPHKDAWTARQQAIDAETRYSDKDIALLAVGDYAAIKTATCQYFGFLKSVGRVNVVIEVPHTCGCSSDDYKGTLDLKFKKEYVKIFSKPRK